ncbi:MAG: DUF4142 domain-containing protein [Balneolaceae bacterium]|nr:DUF4142 domain-containing protein [Balneolaceae bacterium]
MTNADLNTYSIDNTERLDDMEIAHIAYTAGNIDIRYAHLALAISENPEVRNFAQTMIRDHNKVNELALGLLDELGATPKNNSTSRKLMKDAAAMREELMSLKGSAFDKRYAENELAYHQFVNKTVENSFIPSVQNKQFKNLLGQALDIFKVHERHAEKMNRKLMSMN